MAMLCASVSSYAYDFEVNGFYYEVDLDNMTATLVAGENKQSGEISIPASVAYKGREFSVTSINGAFSDNNELTKVTIPKSIESLGARAFEGCSSLQGISGLNNITELGVACFAGCASLTTIDLPEGLKKIGSQAFKGCVGLSSISIPNTVNSIGSEAFYLCSNIESLIIPGNVENIGKSVFSGCSALKVLTFNDGETTLHLPIGSYDGATSVQKKEVNGEIIQFKIQYYKSAFDGLPIEKLYLGRNLSDSPRYTITGDGGVDYYLITSYDSPFNNLPKLRELTIGENVDVLGPNERFITEVEMYVTPGSFKKCSSLEKVSVKNTIPPTGAEFSNTAYSKATLIVPDNTESLYEVAEGWKEFMNIVAETSAGIDEINANKRNEYISVIGEGIIYIGDSVENVYVYGIDGRLILSTVVSPNQSIALSNGLYIIKIKNKSFKVKI